MTIWTAFVGQTWSFAPAQMIQLLKFGILRGAKKSVHCPVMCFEDSKEWKIYIFSLKLHMHWVLNQIPHSPSHFTDFQICSYVWFHLLLKICNGTEQAFVCLRWTYMMHKKASNASFFKFLCILFCVKHSIHQWNK